MLVCCYRTRGATSGLDRQTSSEAIELMKRELKREGKKSKENKGSVETTATSGSTRLAAAGIISHVSCVCSSRRFNMRHGQLMKHNGEAGFSRRPSHPRTEAQTASGGGEMNTVMISTATTHWLRIHSWPSVRLAYYTGINPDFGPVRRRKISRCQRRQRRQSRLRQQLQGKLRVGLRGHPVW